MQLKLAMQGWETERGARMGAGPRAVVCCSATAVPCAAAPAAGGGIGARTPQRLRETLCLIPQVAVFLVAMLSITRAPGMGWSSARSAPSSAQAGDVKIEI